MNPELALLHPYPFEKIRTLLEGLSAADKPAIALSIGEPKHAAPQRVLDALADNLRGVETYPSTRATDTFRYAVANWLAKRYKLSDIDALAAKHILPVNGTREALFAIAQCVLDRSASHKKVLMPNPFYQIYEGATLLAGCEPSFYAISDDADADIAAISEEQFAQCQLIYLCNPGNPTGGVLSEPTLRYVIDKAQQHNFVIVSDECYSEIYRSHAAPPCGLLEAAFAMGNTAYKHCLAFHSLSKRSNLPGLRSGFIAGDAQLVGQFLQYRTYHGCSMSPPIQAASAIAWQDESHVEANRKAYDEKYQAVIPRLKTVLNVNEPMAGFYLWPQLPIDDESFTQKMYSEQNVAVVPGSYLGRPVNAHNPGSDHTRLALVAPLAQCIEAADRIVECLK